MDVLDDSLKVRSGVVGAGDVDVVFPAALDGLLERADRYKLVEDRAEEVETRSELEFGLVGLYDGRDLCNVEVAGGDVLCARDFRDVDVMLSPDLVLGNDELD